MSHSTTRRNRHSYMARPTRRTKQPILIPVAGHRTHRLLSSTQAQKRLWRHDQAASVGLRQDSRQRGEESTIGGARRRAPLLPSKDDELMSQHDQLDVLSEFAAAAADQQP
jgi:hypothetical protein